MKRLLMGVIMVLQLVFLRGYSHNPKLCQKNETIASGQVTATFIREAEKAMGQPFEILDFFPFAKKVFVAKIKEDFNGKVMKDVDFGYTMYSNISIYVIVRTTDNKVPLGKWQVGRTEIFSGHGDLKIIAKKPKRIEEKCFLYELQINKLNMELAVQEWTFTEYSHYGETKIDFKIPHQTSPNEMRHSAFLGELFAGILILFLLLWLISLVYGRCFLEWKYSYMDWGWSYVVFTTFVKLFIALIICLLFFQLLLEVFGGGEKTLNRVVPILIICYVTLVFIPKAMFYLQSLLLQFWMDYSDRVCFFAVLYVVLIFMQGTALGILTYIRSVKCGMKQVDGELRSLAVSEAQSTSNALRAVKRFENSQLIKETNNSLATDKDYDKFVELLGGDVGQVYDAANMKELGRAFDANSEISCQDLKKDLEGLCKDGTADMATTCKEYYDRESKKIKRPLYRLTARNINLGKLCKNISEMNPCHNATKYNGTGCDLPTMSDGVGTYGKAFEKVEGFKKTLMLKFDEYEMDRESIEEPKWKPVGLKDNRFLKIFLTLPKELKIISFFVTLLLLMGSWKRVTVYVGSFLMYVDFDNSYLGRGFRKYNKQRLRKGEASLLPLTIEEREFLQHTEQSFIKSIMSVVMFTILVTCLWYLDYKLEDTHENLAVITANSEMKIFVKRMLNLKVSGRGEKADNLRVLAEAVNVDREKAATIFFTPCMGEARVVPHSLYLSLLVFYLLIITERTLGLIAKYKRFLLNYYYPEVSVRRAKYLYRSIKSRKPVERKVKSDIYQSPHHINKKKYACQVVKSDIATNEGYTLKTKCKIRRRKEQGH